MNLSELQNTVLDALEDIKAQNIQIFDVTAETDMFDRVIVASATSNRQSRALAKNVCDKVKQAKGSVYGTEGEETGEWILVDLGDVVVHIMHPAIRDYYRLEEIWGKTPLEPSRPVTRKEKAVKKPSANKRPAKKPAAKKPTAVKPRVTSKRPARKSPKK